MKSEFQVSKPKLNRLLSDTAVSLSALPNSTVNHHSQPSQSTITTSILARNFGVPFNLRISIVFLELRWLRAPQLPHDARQPETAVQFSYWKLATLRCFSARISVTTDRPDFHRISIVETHSVTIGMWSSNSHFKSPAFRAAFRAVFRAALRVVLFETDWSDDFVNKNFDPYSELMHRKWILNGFVSHPYRQKFSNKLLLSSCLAPA